MAFISRKIQERISKVLQRGKSILLLGPRQTGKTTLVRDHLLSDLYISLANPEIRQALEQDPARLKREIEALNLQKKPLVIIDEVQKIPKLMDAIQDLIDTKLGQFILTGSSARKLRRHSDVNLLPGRVVTLHMDPLSLTELTKPLPNIEELLLYGSLPHIVTESDSKNREEDLISYVTTYLEEEIRAEALVRNMGTFGQFLKLAAIESGNISHFQNLSREIGISNPTISGYYQILVDCLIAEKIEPLTSSLTRKKLVRSPKFLLYDLGIRRVVADEGVGLPEKYMAHLFEQWVGLEIIRFLHFAHERTRLKFWRDINGPEIDWVIENSDQLIPVEVKWSANPTPKDAKRIITFQKEYPNASTGYVICRAPRAQKLSDRVIALPWQELASIFEVMR